MVTVAIEVGNPVMKGTGAHVCAQVCTSVHAQVSFKCRSSVDQVSSKCPPSMCTQVCTYLHRCAHRCTGMHKCACTSVDQVSIKCRPSVVQVSIKCRSSVVQVSVKYIQSGPSGRGKGEGKLPPIVGLFEVLEVKRLCC